MSRRFSIHVENLPFSTQEEELRALMTEVGPVKDVRILRNRTTGKPSGHAFVDFFDAATVESAIRNMNGRELEGRNIRVNYSKSSSHQGPGGPMRGNVPPPPPGRMGMMGPSGAMMGVGDVGGQDMKATLDDVHQVLNGMSPEMRKGLVSKMRTYLGAHKEDAIVVLRENPALAWAFVQILTLDELLPADVPLDSFTIQDPEPKIPVGAHGGPVPPAALSQGGGAAGGPAPMQGVSAAGSSAGASAGASTSSSGPAALMQLLSNIDPLVILQTLGEDNTAMLTHLLSLTPEQFNALPAEQRAALDEISSQLHAMFG